MDILEEPIGWLLAVFYDLVPPHNLGISIILLTCTVMLLLFPLTAKQTRSMIAMQKVQPEIRRIQQKYKDDKAKQNEEIMRFYQENKINPLSGCLPLLMQMPIFFALFGVLRSIQKNIPTTGRFSTLFHDICGTATTVQECEPTGLRFLGMDLSKTATEASGSFVETLPYYILVGLVVLTGWYQARQTMARQKSNGSPALNPQMQIISKVLPVMFGLFSLNFASGLVVYFVASNAWRIGQQQLVLNKFYDAAAADSGPTKAVEGDKPSPQGEGGGGAGRSGKPAPRPQGSAARRKKRRKR